MHHFFIHWQQTIKYYVFNNIFFGTLKLTFYVKFYLILTTLPDVTTQMIHWMDQNYPVDKVEYQYFGQIYGKVILRKFKMEMKEL